MTCRFVLCRGTIAGPGKRSIGGPLSFKRAPYSIRSVRPVGGEPRLPGTRERFVSIGHSYRLKKPLRGPVVRR